MRGTPRIVGGGTSGGGGGGDPTIGNPVIGADPNLFLYTDASGNLYQDALASRDSVTNETYIGYRTGAGQFTNAFHLGNILGGAISDGAGLQRHDASGDNFTFIGTVDMTPFGGNSNSTVAVYADFTNGIFSNHTLDSFSNDNSYYNPVLGVAGNFGVNDTQGYVQHTDNTTYQAQTYWQSDRIQSRYQSITDNVITKVILNNQGVELNYQDGIGSNHFYVTNDTATLSTLQSVRDDTATFTPVNIIYTDNVGKFLSAPISALAPYRLYTENYVSITSPDALGDNSVAIGNGANVGTGSTNSVGIRGSVGANSLNSISIGGNVAGGINDALSLKGTVNGTGATSIGGTANGNSSLAIGASGSIQSTGDASIAIGTNGTSEAIGNQSVVLGNSIKAYSYAETVLGKGNTGYTPNSTTSWDADDRLYVIGCADSEAGIGSSHDAFTILKSGKTGIGYDNFETTTSGAKLQVNGYISATMKPINSTTTLTSNTIAQVNQINESAGNIDITLPATSTITTNTGLGDLSPVFTFKCVGGSSNTVRLLPNGSSNIEGTSSYTFPSVSTRPFVSIYTDGSNWWIINK